MYFEYTYPVDSRDVDCFGQCRPSALLGYLQEAATEAAAALGASRSQVMERYHAFWMLARVWYRLDRPLIWGSEVTVRTFHRNGKGASMYRDFDLFVNGEPVGEAVSVWAMADLDTHKPIRLSNLEEFKNSSGGELCKDRVLTRVHLPAEMHPAVERRLWYSDADMNRHVNNNRYADFACDALGLEDLGEGRYVSSLQVSFLAECRPGETLELWTGGEGEVRFVHGTDREEKARFDAEVTLSST